MQQIQSSDFQLLFGPTLATLSRPWASTRRLVLLPHHLLARPDALAVHAVVVLLLAYAMVRVHRQGIGLGTRGHAIRILVK